MVLTDDTTCSINACDLAVLLFEAVLVSKEAGYGNADRDCVTLRCMGMVGKLRVGNCTVLGFGALVG